MIIKELVQILDEIISNGLLLKSQYILEPVTNIFYVGIVARNQFQGEEIINLIHKIGTKIVFSDHWGDIYLLNTPVNSKVGIIKLIKVCNPDKLAGHTSYVDFTTDNFEKLVQKYSGNPKFSVFHGWAGKTLGIKDPSTTIAIYIVDYINAKALLS